MKLNATPKHYMPLSQSQSDDEESLLNKEDKAEQVIFKNSFEASEISKGIKTTNNDNINLKSLPMSTTRFVMFILSLFICLFFVLIFVYCLPCTMIQYFNDLCYLKYKWEKVLHNSTYASPMAIIYNKKLKKEVIVLGFRDVKSGLIAIQENDGNELWKLQLHSLPLSISCDKLDANSDGSLECLVIGEEGLLTAIDTNEGVSLWYLHNHSNLNRTNSISGPVIVPDCNDDDIGDIIISYKVVSNEDRSHLAVVSGETGQIIGSLIELPHCFQPSLMRFSWMSKNDQQLVLHCKTNSNDELWLLSAINLCDSAKNETMFALLSSFRIPNFKDIQFYKTSDPDHQFVIVLDGNQFLLLKCHQTFQIVWHTYLNADQHMRIISDGQFFNDSLQLVVTDSGTPHSQIVGLSLLNGREVWSILNESGTVVSATKFIHFFGDTDGLLIKTVDPVIKPCAFKEVLHENATEDFVKGELQIQRVANLRSVQENYIFVKCGKVPVFKVIIEEIIRVDCQVTGSCLSDMYVINSTVIVKADEKRNSFKLITVTSSESPSNINKDMIIKSYNLEDVPAHSTCK